MMSRASKVIQRLHEAQGRDRGRIQKVRRILLHGGIVEAEDLPDDVLQDLLQHVDENGKPTDQLVRLLKD